MQLTKHALTITKIFFSKLFSIVIVYSAVYIFRSHAGTLDQVEQINSFSIIFIAAYFLSISAAWTAVYYITCVAYRFNESWRKTTVLWIVMYAIFWIFTLHENMYRYEEWNLAKLSVEVASGTVKTLPSLLIFILVFVKKPHGLLFSNKMSDNPKILDSELARFSSDDE